MGTVLSGSLPAVPDALEPPTRGRPPQPAHGRLLPPTSAPAHGERSERVVRIGDVEVEQVLSGVLGDAVTYDQEYDEWALVLEGAAVLEIGAARVELAAGEWVLLPAHLVHRLVDARPGTSWLTLRAGPADTHGTPQ